MIHSFEPNNSYLQTNINLDVLEPLLLFKSAIA